MTAEDLLLGQENRSNHNENLEILFAQERKSAYATVQHRPTDSVELFSDVFYAKRDYSQDDILYIYGLKVPSSNPYYVSPEPDTGSVTLDWFPSGELGTQSNTGDVESYGGAIGAGFDLWSDWQLRLDGSYAKDDFYGFLSNYDAARLNEAVGFDNPDTPFNPAVDGYLNPFSDGVNSPRNVIDYIVQGGSARFADGAVWTIQSKLDGSVLWLPGGAVKLALGGAYREEDYNRTNYVIDNGVRQWSSTQTRARREVSSGFAELLVPLWGKGNRRVGLERLMLSAAWRHENYSDFGTSSNPKLGLEWTPLDGLTVRGSWGRSFRAPDLPDVHSRRSVRAYSGLFRDPANPERLVTVLMLQGTEPKIGPERSTARTLGLDFKRPDGVDLSLTWFDIRYRDRISTVPGSILSALTDPVFAPVVTLRPSASVVQSLLDSPDFDPMLGTPTAGDVFAIINYTRNNLASTHVAGLDFTGSYNIPLSSGQVSFGLNANYLFQFENKVTVSAPTFDAVNTVGNPVDLTIRGNASFSRGRFNGSLFVNYTDSYADTVSSFPRSVEAWTTVDLNMSYRLEAGEGWWNNTTIAINTRNLFDEDPPFVNQNFGYDSANADPVGRFISVSASKSW